MYKLITLLGIYFITGNSIIFIVWPVSGWIRIIKTVKNNNPFPDNMVQINKTRGQHCWISCQKYEKKI